MKFPDWEPHALKVKKCDLCFPVDGKSVLLGHGNPEARIMCVGIAPSLVGKDAPDRKVFGLSARPFYEKFLEIIGETWGTVWTTNLVKCTIPFKELGDKYKCAPLYFQWELDNVDPHYVVLFGREVVDFVLGGNGHGLYGEVYTRDGKTFITMLHPAYPARSPNAASTFYDLARDVREIVKQQTLFEATK